MKVIATEPANLAIDRQFHVRPSPMNFTADYAKFHAHEPTRRAATCLDRLSFSLFDLAVDLNPRAPRFLTVFATLGRQVLPEGRDRALDEGAVRRGSICAAPCRGGII